MESFIREQYTLVREQQEINATKVNVQIQGGATMSDLAERDVYSLWKQLVNEAGEKYKYYIEKRELIYNYHKGYWTFIIHGTRVDNINFNVGLQIIPT